MSDTLEDRGIPRWASLGPGARPARNLGHAVVGPMVVTVVAVLAWRDGHEIAAVLAAGLGLLTLQAAVLSPGFRTRLDAVGRILEAIVSAVLSVVLLLPIYLLVVTPIGLYRRLVGTTGIDTRADPDATSYWVRRSRVDDRFRARQFVDERRWRSLRPNRRERRGLIVRTALAIVVVEALVLGAVLVIRDERSEPPTLGGVASPSASDSAALAGLDWVPEAARETSEVTSGLVYSPFTGASLRDYEGNHVNVHNRVRRSYEAALPPGAPTVDVWFFGGSTMFGFDLQRDLHTIPSELVRLAEADGIAVRARNYGSPDYVNFQETTLLGLLASAGERPDLAVFYDGINDKSLALANAYGSVNPAGEPAELGSHQIRQALAESGIIPGGSAEPPPGLVPRERSKPVTAASLAADTMAVYRQGVELSRSHADTWGFDVAHFWQPDLYSRRPLDPGEEALLDTLHLDEPQFDAMSRLSHRIRRELPSGVVDISDAFDDVDGPVLSDFIHTNEVGAAAVARRMYAELRPRLLELSAPG